MKKYNQLTLKERIQIQLLYEHDYKQAYISDYIGKNNSTISRELKRNRLNEASNGKYKAEYAEKFATLRKTNSASLPNQ